MGYLNYGFGTVVVSLLMVSVVVVESVVIVDVESIDVESDDPSVVLLVAQADKNRVTTPKENAVFKINFFMITLIFD